MTNINRFSSRRQRLDKAFLSARLKGARSYKRIAGYFRSSIFELVGEEIASIPRVQIVCNSELDAADIAISKHVRDTALKERWNEAPSEVESLLHRDRYRRLGNIRRSRTICWTSCCELARERNICCLARRHQFKPKCRKSGISSQLSIQAMISSLVGRCLDFGAIMNGRFRW